MEVLIALFQLECGNYFECVCARKGRRRGAVGFGGFGLLGLFFCFLFAKVDLAGNEKL